jgi:bla regulator protein blaR1
MLQYILECISFQLIFLIIYDFFLKKETFFQWNRLYLLSTHVLSLTLPWIKIEAFKTEVPTEYFVYPEFLWNMDSAPITVTAIESSILNISWQQGVFFLGLLGATLLFGYKMHQLYRLRKNGDVHYFLNFTRIIVANSNLAFSFFKSIFLGDKVLAKEQENIIKHELVHIQQKHSWDLLFFELLRIVFWFNPLVYVYQSRISELHEFIADAQVAKTNKKEQYQLLLSQVFQTQHISFVNQFFKTSLIKKRIAMIQKSRSKKIWQLKYLLLVPIVLGMLAYTSSETQTNDIVEQEQTSDDAILIKEITKKIEKDIKDFGDVDIALYAFISAHNNYTNAEVFTKKEFFEYRILMNISTQKRLKELNAKGGIKYNSSLTKPTSVIYTSYVNRREAFQLLDKDLDISINMNKQDVILIDKKDINSIESYVINVGDISDVTADEIKFINGMIEDVLEKGDSKYKSLVLKDNQYAFRVLKKAEQVNDGRNKTKEMYTFLKQSKVEDSKHIPRKIDSIVSFAVVEEVPIFPGCENDDDKRGCFYENIREHIRKNFRYPEEAQERGIQGKVKVIFMIDQNGSITNIHKHGIELILLEESDRIISLLPKMTPGKHKGKLVKVPFSIPITFKLVSENAAQNPQLQNVQNNIDVPFAVADEIPIFPGCEGEGDSRGCFQKMLQKHISKNFRYPEEAQKLGIQGRVSIIFIIDQDGNTTNIRKRGPHKLLEAEAERIITLLPKMTPGKHDGKTVNIPFSIPIAFKLDSDSVEQKKEFKNAQDDMDIPFAIVDEVPVFPGCENDDDKRGCFQESMREHIRKNFRYPEEAQKLEIQGRVSVIFVMDKKGDITNVRVKGPHKLLEDEAVRIISLLPSMKPGKQKGKEVNVPFSIPITFKLQGESSDTKIQKLNLNGPDPLFIVDGVEFSKKEISKVRPDNIESIRVLKDDADVEKYGPRGKNGVVEISTKKMDLGTMSVSAYTKIEGHKKYISGKVTDGSRGLPGVNVIVQGANRAVVSNFDGEFTIEVQKGDIITFQYIGLPTAALTVTDQEKYLITASE